MMTLTSAQERRVQRVAPWLLLAAVLLLWQGACMAFGVSDFILPTPSAIVASLVEYAGVIAGHAWRTFWTTMVGFGVAIAVGVLLGLAMGSSRLLYAASYPLMTAFNALPKAAFVPILVVWFGLGAGPAILTAFLISFFPIMVNIATGLATLEPELEDVLRVLGAKKRDILWNVSLPRALPYLFASLKIAITLAFVGTVLAETVAANKGIGTVMMLASGNFDVPMVFAGLLILAVLGVALYALSSLVERRMTGWAQRKTDLGMAS